MPLSQNKQLEPGKSGLLLAEVCYLGLLAWFRYDLKVYSTSNVIKK